MKTKVIKKSNVKERKKKKRKISKKAIIVLIATLLVAIMAVIGIVYGIRWLVITLKYKEYTDKMYTYGLAELYDNQKATANEKVSNEEMVKIVLAAITGNKEDYDLKYAIDNSLVKKITIESSKEKANKIDTTIFTTRTLTSMLQLNIEPVELKMSKKKLLTFTSEEQQVIAKAVSIGIIPNRTIALSNSNILKGELNKMVITLLEKYATIYYKTVGVNEYGIIEKQDVNLVTNIKDMPDNYKEYPYIVDNIQKEIYEYDFIGESSKNFISPKEAYKYFGELYAQTDETLVLYFDAILNVDYTNITYENFLSKIKNKVVYRIDESDVKTYVDYVKKNKIKITGEATPLIPIIYGTGTNYVVRTKVTFKIESSNTDTNILFGDETNNVKYNGKEFTIYVEVPMSMTLNSKSLRVKINCLATNLTKDNKNIKIEK